MTDLQLLQADFKQYFGREMIPYSEAGHFFETEALFIYHFKNLVYFKKAVIEPLEKKGMSATDSVVDLACGLGQMALALALLGYRNLTLYDMDTDRLKVGMGLIDLYCNGYKPVVINASAMDLKTNFDVLICYQTIEHLSDEGNYSVAKKHCQVAFLERVNKHINKLCYFNAPNRNYPIDGHDTGKPFFHYLPIPIKRFLIYKNFVKCSWEGICRPISIGFLNRHLPRFKLDSTYYAFDSMVDYVSNYPSFDYKGQRIPKVDPLSLSAKKKLVNWLSLRLGKGMQRILPVMSVIYSLRDH